MIHLQESSVVWLEFKLMNHWSAVRHTAGCIMEPSILAIVLTKWMKIMAKRGHILEQGTNNKWLNVSFVSICFGFLCLKILPEFKIREKLYSLKGDYLAVFWARPWPKQILWLYRPTPTPQTVSVNSKRWYGECRFPGSELWPLAIMCLCWSMWNKMPFCNLYVTWLFRKSTLWAEGSLLSL